MAGQLNQLLKMWFRLQQFSKKNSNDSNVHSGLRSIQLAELLNNLTMGY